MHINPAGSRALHTCLPPDGWATFVASAGESTNLGFITQQLEELLVADDATETAAG